MPIPAPEKDFSDIPERLFWFLYNLLFAAAFALMLPRYLMRMRKRGGYRDGFAQRLGLYSEKVEQACWGEQRVWIHAVSVGEIHVALKLVEEIRSVSPHLRFIVSTTTSTGYAVAKKHIDQRDLLIYYPVDFPPAVELALQKLSPRALILVEGELWPNMIRAAYRRQIPVAVVNGRLSPASYRGYRLCRIFFRRVIRRIELLLVQSTREKRCFIELGCDPSRIEVYGSAKYDVVATAEAADSEANARQILALAGIADSSRLLVCGSTWPGEEDILVNVYLKLRKDFSDLRLVLVPRHMERREAVETLINNSGISCVMRSRLGKEAYSMDHADDTDVLVVDSTGELMGFYAVATVVFVGKSLSQHGGQNFLEPAVLGKPVIVGPHLENFPVIAEQFDAAGALIQVESASELEAAIRNLLQNDDMSKKLGELARATVLKNRGVITRSVKRLLSVLLDDAK